MNEKLLVDAPVVVGSVDGNDFLTGFIQSFLIVFLSEIGDR